jgi:uncharacterized protein YbaA (DUF1428 family)
MSYVDGYVIALPTAGKQAFVDLARKTDAMFIEHGALRVLECWGDDVPEGKLTDFRRAVQARPDETVVFSWIEWPDKDTRDAGMAKVMADPGLSPEPRAPIFDGKRMIFGGFTPVVDLATQGRCHARNATGIAQTLVIAPAKPSTSRWLPPARR